jgi:TrpR family trp operon transcriptional repressor
MKQTEPVLSEKGWRGFFKLCQSIKDSKQLQEFFEVFLAKEEVEMLSARYWIVRALIKGELTQREIAKKYKVSIAQITRGSNALKSISPKLKAFLKNN